MLVSATSEGCVASFPCVQVDEELRNGHAQARHRRACRGVIGDGLPHQDKAEKQNSRKIVATWTKPYWARVKGQPAQEALEAMLAMYELIMPVQVWALRAGAGSTKFLDLTSDALHDAFKTLALAMRDKRAHIMAALPQPAMDGGLKDPAYWARVGQADIGRPDLANVGQARTRSRKRQREEP